MECNVLDLILPQTVSSELRPTIVAYYLCFNEYNLPEGQYKATTLVSPTGQAVVAHALIPTATLVSLRGLTMVLIPALERNIQEETGLTLNHILRICGGRKVI